MRMGLFYTKGGVRGNGKGDLAGRVESRGSTTGARCGQRFKNLWAVLYEAGGAGIAGLSDHRHRFGSQLAMKGESLYKTAHGWGVRGGFRKHKSPLLPKALTAMVNWPCRSSYYVPRV